MNIDLANVARDLNLPPEKLALTVELLDEGNTIPFITRFRKDETGGLNENQVLAVKQKIAQLRALAERKTFVLKSIESQGRLTDELKSQIEGTGSSRTLEDLYRPFKSRKQTRSATARQQGLEPLADDVLSGASASEDLGELAAKFVRVDKGLSSVDDVFKGVTDLLVEKFGENRELRNELRKIVWSTGQLCTQLIEAPASEGDGSKLEGSDGESTDKSKDETTGPASEQTPEQTTPNLETESAKVEQAAEGTEPAPASSGDGSASEQTTASSDAEQTATSPDAEQTADAPAGEASGGETPATETPATETPASETPASAVSYTHLTLPTIYSV